MKHFLKNTFFILAQFFPCDTRGRASILMYHSISDEEDFFCVRPGAFRKQMQRLKRDREVITLQDLLIRMEKGTLKGTEVVVTFDDGYADNYTRAFPVLRELEIPATVFVTTGLVGKKDKKGRVMLDEKAIREMHESGFIDIEPHSVSHPKLAKLKQVEVEKEMQDSKRYLEELLGKTCEFFAYPSGNYNNESISILRKLNFAAGLTVSEGTVDSSTDHFRLRRNSIDRSTSSVQFAGKISRAIDLYCKMKSL